MPMQDHEIAAEIARRGLEIVYLSELAASLGFASDEGWSEAVIDAIERATPEQRRRAALRTLRSPADES
jgi:hypothetical protein